MKLHKILTPNLHAHTAVHLTCMTTSTDTRYETSTCIQIFLTDLEYSLDPAVPCEVTKIFVRPLRHKFIVTALVNGITTKSEIPREEVELFPPIAACTSGDCGCAGPLGSICDQPECLDSRNIFADNLPYIDSVTLCR